MFFGKRKRQIFWDGWSAYQKTRATMISKKRQMEESFDSLVFA